MAYVKRKEEFIGFGAAIQAVGVIGLFFFPIGTIAGIILFIIGSIMATKYICSECRNNVEKGSKMCPVCKVKLIK